MIFRVFPLPVNRRVTDVELYPDYVSISMFVGYYMNCPPILRECSFVGFISLCWLTSFLVRIKRSDCWMWNDEFELFPYCIELRKTELVLKCFRMVLDRSGLKLGGMSEFLTIKYQCHLKSIILPWEMILGQLLSNECLGEPRMVLTWKLIELGPVWQRTKCKYLN